MADTVTDDKPVELKPAPFMLDSRIPLSQQAGKLAKQVMSDVAKEEDTADDKGKKEDEAEVKPSGDKKTPDEAGAEKPAEATPPPEDDDEDEPAAPAQAVELGEVGKYILDKLPTLTTRIKDGDTVKVVKFKDINELPQGFELADDAARAQFTVDVAAQVDRAKGALNDYKQAELNENVRKFEEQQTQDVADDIAFLQKRGILPAFKYAEDDPKFNSDEAVKTANEIYDLFNKINQQYASKYNGTGRMYRISYRDAADKYFARAARSSKLDEGKANEQPNKPEPGKKTPKATEERQQVARQQGAPQGGEPSGNKFRPRPGMKMSDINRLISQGRI